MKRFSDAGWAAWLLSAGWVLWLLALPAFALWIQTAVDHGLATTPGDDCTIAWMVFFWALVPWLIGILVLSAISLLLIWLRRHSS